MIFMFGGRNDTVCAFWHWWKYILPVLNAERIRHDK